MKTFKTKKSFKAILIAFFLGFIFFIINFSTTGELIAATFSEIIIIYVLIQSFLIKVLIDKNGITYVQKFWPQITISLNWKEVGLVKSSCNFFPEVDMIVRIHPKQSVDKKFIFLLMPMLPIELLRELLTHLDDNVEVLLHSYLKRKLEGKRTIFYKDNV